MLDLTVGFVTYRLILLILRLLGWLFCRVCHELSLCFNCVHHLDGGSLPTRRLGVNFQHTIAANLLHLTVNANFAFAASIADSKFLTLEKIGFTINSSFFINLNEILSQLLTVLFALVRRPTALVSHNQNNFRK